MMWCWAVSRHLNVHTFKLQTLRFKGKLSCFILILFLILLTTFWTTFWHRGSEFVFTCGFKELSCHLIKLQLTGSSRWCEWGQQRDELPFLWNSVTAFSSFLSSTATVCFFASDHMLGCFRLAALHARARAYVCVSKQQTVIKDGLHRTLLSSPAVPVCVWWLWTSRRTW